MPLLNRCQLQYSNTWINHKKILHRSNKHSFRLTGRDTGVEYTKGQH